MNSYHRSIQASSSMHVHTNRFVLLDGDLLIMREHHASERACETLFHKTNIGSFV